MENLNNISAIENYENVIELLEKLKSENKILKNKITEIKKELNLQLKENSLPCNMKAENFINKFPNEITTQDVADIYNKSANTERLIFIQKLKYIKNITE